MQLCVRANVPIRGKIYSWSIYCTVPYALGLNTEVAGHQSKVQTWEPE
jgi:hypothetical protein